MRISDWSSDVCSSDLQRPSGNIVWSQCHWRGRVDLLSQTYLRIWRLWGSRIWAFQCFTHRRQIGRAHVCTPVTNAHLVCRLLLHTKKTHITLHAYLYVYYTMNKVWNTTQT